MKNIRTYHDLPTCEMCFWSSSLDLFRVSFPYNFFFFFRPCAIFLVLLCNNWPKNSYHSKYISDSWDFRIVWAYHLIHVFQIWSRGFFFGFQCFLLDFQLHSYRSFNTRGKLFLVHTWTIGVSNIDIYKTALAFSENFLCNLNVLIALLVLDKTRLGGFAN